MRYFVRLMGLWKKACLGWSEVTPISFNYNTKAGGPTIFWKQAIDIHECKIV